MTALIRDDKYILSLQCDAWQQPGAKPETRNVTDFADNNKSRITRFQLWYNPDYSKVLLLTQFQLAAGTSLLTRGYLETSCDKNV